MCFSAILQELFFFLLYAQKKKKQKEKAPAAAPELKNRCISLNEKELATLKQLFVLNGKYSIFLNAPTRRPGKPIRRLTHRFAR